MGSVMVLLVAVAGLRQQDWPVVRVTRAAAEGDQGDQPAALDGAVEVAFVLPGIELEGVAH